MTTARVREYGAPVLTGRCDSCGKPKRAGELNLVLMQARQSWEPKWVLLCGTCFVDGAS